MIDGHLRWKAGRRGLLFLVTACAALALSAPAAAQAQEAHVLIYSGTVAHRHVPAIDQGIGPIQDALDAAGISYDWENCGEIAAIPNCQDANQNPRIFTPENLAQYDAIYLFNAGGNPLWTEPQRNAIQGFVNDGGGIAANHLATDMGVGQPSWGWWDGVGNSALGTTMPGHPAAPQTATVHVSDRNHPSTRDLPDTVQHSDEHYSFTRSVRGTHHVLATLDETTYDPLMPPHGGGNGPVEMGADHPISWCRLYDGGRIWATSMGHFPDVYTANGGDNYLIHHLVGGIQWAAGIAGAAEDCGGTVWGNFRRTVLSTQAQGPIGLDVTGDGRVYWTEIGPDGHESFGRVKMWDPDTGETSLVAQIETRADALSASEDGVLGMALDPAFESNRHLYIYYSPRGEGLGWPMAGTGMALGYNRLSRFTLDATGTEVVAEQPILDVPKVKVGPQGDGVAGQDRPNWPAHTGGAGLDIDSEGNLYLGVGDDANPYGEGQEPGFVPIDQRHEHRYDARNTSANTNDLRGKVLRIDPLEEIPAGTEPGVDDTYQIPAGNMFAPGTPETRPEIYAMGFRQPFTVQADPGDPGTVVVGEYGPDSGFNGTNPPRGPAGIIEWNHITGPGFYGWPFCTGDNSVANTYFRWEFPDGPSGDQFDCSTAEIPNESSFNTGLDDIPGPAEQADVWHKRNGEYPEEFGLPPNSYQEPNTGPIYRYDPDNPSETKWPAYYDGSWLILDRGNNWWREARIRDDSSGLLRVNQFLQPNQFGTPNNDFPIPIKFGPDGALYMGLWSGGCCRNLSESQGRIVRIDYVGEPEDEIPPEIDATVQGLQNEDGDYLDRGTLRLEATDGNGSGVERIEYSVNGGEWVPVPNGGFAEPFVTSAQFDDEGDYEIDYRAFDRVGNPSEEGAVSFTVVPGVGCEYLRSDEFESPVLDTSKWTVRIDDPTYEATVEDGQLVLPVLDEIDGARTGPLSLVSQPVPGGDWTATTRVTIDHETNWQQGGLMLWQSDGNFVKVGFTADGPNLNQRRFEITSDDPTNVRHFSTDVGVPADFPTTAWIRMSRNGNVIGGEFAPDVGGEPGAWSALATRPVSGVDPANGIDINPPREGEGVLIGPYAGGEYGAPWSNTAAFDFVRFEPDEVDCSDADTEPPVTTVQLNGAAPQPSYEGPVEASFDATDPGESPSGVESTEYRIDSSSEGDWVAYDPANPPTIAAEGAHAIDYRSTDVAGNVEDANQVAFAIGAPGGGTPRGNPVLRASVAPKFRRARAGKAVRFRVRVANVGDAATGPLRICVRAPKRRVRVIGKRCKAVGSLAPGQRAARAFRLRPKRSARGKRVRIRFVANGPGVERRVAVARLRVRR